MKKYLILIFFSSWVAGAIAQERRPGEDGRAMERLDSLTKVLDRQTRSKIKPFDSVIRKDAIAFRGLFTVYKVEDKFYLEIPDSIFNLPILVMSQLVKAPDLGKYPGEMLEGNTFYFGPGRDSTILLYALNTGTAAEEGTRMAKAVANAAVTPIVLRFPIVARGRDGHSWVVAGNELLAKRSPVMPFAGGQNFHMDRIEAYPENMNFTFSRVTESNFYTYSYSYVALPRVPMQPRLADKRIGYFPGNSGEGTKWFSDVQQRVKDRVVIARWRLEPKPEDREKWERGELVEPAKPIVYYIDPNTPKKWVKYLIAGVNDWNAAFEQAGFKNAIMAKEWPEGTPADLHDARYSFLCYLPSETSNAYGPHICDPRSGEVIQSHVGWYHNVMVILNGWYKVQASALDPTARTPTFNDELMGQLVRFVSSHEVGHTLGLAHNQGSSSQSPVEKLRDKNWLKQHGHTASIMDYARFDYIAQPEDSIPRENLWPHIGEYDRWAIQWGYKRSGASDPEEDRLIVNKWATDSLASNPRLWFGSEEGEASNVPNSTAYLPFDPRCQTECVGDNNMVGNTYGILNMKRVLSSFTGWDHVENGVFEDWDQVYGWAVWTMKKHWIQQVLAYVGGRSRTWKSEDAAGDVYEPTPKTLQKEALAWLNEQLFNTPTWLMDPAFANKIIQPEPKNIIQQLQDDAMHRLLDGTTLARLSANVTQFGVQAAYTPDEYFRDLHGYIWGGLASGKPMDFYRRDLQKEYIIYLGMIVAANNQNVRESEYWTAAYMDFLRIRDEVKAALKTYPAGDDRDHLETILFRMGKFMKLNPLFN
ncbi:MAG TPA: zinc-dependent metalloprotease [Puia sp.]|jgi:hypothetical protein